MAHLISVMEKPVSVMAHLISVKAHLISVMAHLISVMANLASIMTDLAYKHYHEAQHMDMYRLLRLSVIPSRAVACSKTKLKCEVHLISVMTHLISVMAHHGAPNKRNDF